MRTPSVHDHVSEPTNGSVTPLFPGLTPDSFEPIPAVDASPAAYLRLTLDSLHMSQSQLAVRTGLSTKHVNQLVQGLVALSPDTALRFERALGVPSGIWTALEAARQDAAIHQRAREQQGEWTAWLHHFPVRDLQEREVLDPRADAAGQIGQLLSFFRVADPAAYDEVWSTPVAAGFRRSKHLDVDPYATAAWLRLAEQQAATLALAEFSVQRFTELLPQLPKLTLLTDDTEALQLLQQQCADVGVAVVVVREVAGARACGAARWPSPANPMIVLSGRYQYADSLWFSFFHEAAHVAHHPKRATYIRPEGGGDDVDGLESEADAAALRYLLGPKAEARLRPGLKHQEVRDLAAQAGVDPGIVAGCLSHKINDYVKYRRFRRKTNLPRDLKG